MKHPRGQLFQLRQRAWHMPATLAALSCALALFVAQPVSAQAPHAPRSIVRITGDVPHEPLAAAHFVTPVAQKTIGFSTAAFTPRQLHVLATVEMLCRFFAFDLRSSDHAFTPLAFLAPLELCRFELVVLPTCLGYAAAIAPQPRQCQFLCLHTHLPPPAHA